MPDPGWVSDGFLGIQLDTARGNDVPEPVWKHTLGGHQVLKKWLSYREQALLHRPLTGEEAREFTHHVRRIAVLLRKAQNGTATTGRVRESERFCTLPSDARLRWFFSISYYRSRPPVELAQSIDVVEKPPPEPIFMSEPSQRFIDPPV